MIDTNIKGVLYGIAAAFPVFQRQGSGHFINVASVAGIKVHLPPAAWCTAPRNSPSARPE